MAVSLVITTLEGLANKPDKRPSCLSKINIPTEALLCNTPGCIIPCGELENYCADVVNCLSHSAEVCVPSVRVGVEKQWWTPELDDLK